MTAILDLPQYIKRGNCHSNQLPDIATIQGRTAKSMWNVSVDDKKGYFRLKIAIRTDALIWLRLRKHRTRVIINWLKYRFHVNLILWTTTDPNITTSA